MRRLAMCALAGGLLGCNPFGGEPGPPDTGARDAGFSEAGPPDASDGHGGDDAGLDGGVEHDAGATDAGVVGDDGATPRDAGGPRGSMPAPPAVLVRVGSGGLLLRGRDVLAPSGPIRDGEVLIVGDTIQCVATDCTSHPMASDATIVETHATISPGLIDAHNHATYDFLGEWTPDPMRLFGNRYEWAADPMYEAHVAPEADLGSSGTLVCPATKWAELRSIIHGTTTIMGQSPEQSCVNRLARNADHYHGLGPDRMQTTIASVRSITDAQRSTLVSAFLAGTTSRYVVHMAEGVAGGSIDREYASYVARPGETRTISLLSAPDGTPYGTSVFIHGIAMTADEVAEAVAARAHFVWSPSSNLALYGATAPIAELLARGAVVGLGPDWTISGADEMLSEMRFALAWAAAEGVAAVTPAVLHRMATSDGARVLGLEHGIGRLEPGLRADVAVFGRIADDPYLAVAESRAADVRLVLIDGAAYYGELSLEAATAVNGDCDGFDACGVAKFLCVANTPGSSSRASETLEDVRAQLRAILAPYGRADELLELVDCSL